MCICTPSVRTMICPKCPSVMAERLKEKQNVPHEAEPVLAQISQINSLGKSSWHEVVYHDGQNWKSYEASKTFNDGERVVQWRYVNELMPSV